MRFSHSDAADGLPNLLSAEQVIALHDLLVEDTGDPLGILNINLLYSAIAQPENGRLYRGYGIFHMAATYAYHISRNHAFIEGNKRAAAIAADTFLKINTIDFRPDQKEYADIITGTVLGKVSKQELDEFFWMNSRPISSPETEQ